MFKQIFTQRTTLSAEKTLKRKIKQISIDFEK